MRWYTLPGWPARVNGHAAAMPHLTRPPGSGQQYKDGLTGRPGTAMVMQGSPGVPTGVVAQAQRGFSVTADCPGFYPNQYWARPEASYWPGAGMPVSYRSDNLMPIPATDPRGINAPLQQALVLLGQAQIGSDQGRHARALLLLLEQLGIDRGSRTLLTLAVPGRLGRAAHRQRYR